MHGVWDAQSKFVGPYIAPHTNITEIVLGLDLLWRAGVDPGKVVLGQGWVRSHLANKRQANLTGKVRPKLYAERPFLQHTKWGLPVRRRREPRTMLECCRNS